MLYFGFSGGPVVDSNGRLLGISFGASKSESVFVDARRLHKISFDDGLFN
jgi:hypothetical protein